MKNSLIIAGITANSDGGASNIPTITWYADKSGYILDTSKNLSKAKLIEVYRDGLLLQPEVDYSISGSEITFNIELTINTVIAVKIYGKVKDKKPAEIIVISDEDGNIIISADGITYTDGNIVLQENVDVLSDNDGNIILK